jgi:hypothetical protein
MTETSAATWSGASIVLRDDCVQNCGPGAVAAPPRDTKVLVCRENSSRVLNGARSGASRDRTGDLLHAMQALSQLSYSPNALLMLSRSRRLGDHAAMAGRDQLWQE